MSTSISVLLIGNSASGKSAYLERLSTGLFEPAHGSASRDSQTVTIQRPVQHVYDEQEPVDFHTIHFHECTASDASADRRIDLYHSVDAIVLFLDATNPESVHEFKRLRNEILHHNDNLAPWFVFWNKMDSPQRIRLPKNSMCRSLHMSVKTCFGIENSVSTIIQSVA